MKRYSTAEVAEIVRVHKATLRRWLQQGAIPEPKHNRIAGVNYRVWTDRDVERVRHYKAAHYMKKPRKKR